MFGTSVDATCFRLGKFAMMTLLVLLLPGSALAAGISFLPGAKTADIHPVRANLSVLTYQVPGGLLVADRLAPGGRLEMITWTTAGDHGLEIVPLLAAALPEHGVHIESLTESPLGPLADRFHGSPGYAAWRDRLSDRGLDRVVMVFVRAQPAAEPAFTYAEPQGAITAARSLADEW